MKKPNILLIYSDQLRFDASSREGNTTVRTPTYDRLAASGACFERAYTSFPLCCPFRASLMTGTYAHVNGMCTNHYPIDLDCGRPFLPQLVKEKGYRTAWIGKWHLNGGNKFDYVPEKYQLGFDRFIGFSRGHHYIDSIFYRDNDPTPRTSHLFEPEFQTEHLFEFMSESIETHMPFMAMICYGIPHFPVDMAPEKYLNMYSPEDVELPDTVPEWKKDHSRAYRAHYYGLVSCVDDQLARIDGWLKEKGIFDNTAVIFVSDHGDMCSEFGLEDKSIYYEAASHVPLAIRWPEGINAGVTVRQLVDPSIDLFPTILELCGAEVPSFAQGKTLLTAAKSGNDSKREDLGYYELLKVSDEACEALDILERKQYPERGLRTSCWLYIEKCGVPYALYDLRLDPKEKYNLVSDNSYLHEMNRLRARLADKMQETGDSWEIQTKTPPPHYQTHMAAKNWHESLLKKAIVE